MVRMSSTSQFQKNLPILRRRAGFTQESLAEALGVSRQAVGKWESGAALPEAATLLTLGELLDCSLDDLMLRELRDGPETLPTPATQPEAAENELLLQDYDRHMNRFALLIASGVLLILVGVGQMMALLGLLENAAAGVGLLLLCVAAAVFLFVWGGLSHDSFLKTFPGFPADALPQPTQSFTRLFQFGLPAAIALIVADVALFAVAASFFHSRRVILLCLALFFFLLGLAVGAIVYLGILKSRYTPDGQRSVIRAEDAVPAPEHPLCGAVMLGATVLYLILGFVLHLWHPGWLVFPLATAVCAILNARIKK